MAFDTKGFAQAAQQAGFTPEQIDSEISRRTGVRGWLTGGNKGFGGVATGAANLLSLPSFAIGGVLNQGQRAFGSKYGQDTGAKGLGVLEGIKNKRAVFTEAPETLGIDPNSKLGMGIGFGAELLTPDIPLLGAGANAFRSSKLAKAGRGLGKSRKLGNITDDAARVLLEKSYKLSASDIQKVADAIGVTDESQKAIKVIDYLEGLGLKGSNRGSLKTLNDITSGSQKGFNKLTRTGGEISRTPYIDNLLNEAIKAEKLDTPQSRRLSKQLFEEAYNQSLKTGKPLTDTDLTNKISKLFNESSASALGDPLSSNLSKRMAIAGQDARETLRPGSKLAGRELRGLRTAQDVVGKKANTGLGTQLINSFKPSGAGFGVGAVAGYSTDRNPLVTGLIGGLGGVALNNPRVMNSMGKFLQKGTSLPRLSKPTSRFGKTAFSTVKKLPQTSFKVGVRDKTKTNETSSRQSKQSKPVVKQQRVRSSVYDTPKNVFNNKSAFGKKFKLKARN